MNNKDHLVGQLTNADDAVDEDVDEDDDDDVNLPGDEQI